MGRGNGGVDPYPITSLTSEYLADATTARLGMNLPSEGDLIVMSGGSQDRITSVLNCTPDKHITEWQGLLLRFDTDAPNDHGFFIGNEGIASYSGSLSYPRSDRLVLHGKQLAKFWFPESADLRPGCAVYADIPVHVWIVE